MDLSTEAVERVATKLDGVANHYYPLLKEDVEQAAALLRALAGEREVKWRCDWPGCTNTKRHGHAGMPPTTAL